MKGNKILLNGVSGRFRPGYLSAILGPSGAGKTTLLNLLSGFSMSGSIEGSITVNKEPRNLTQFRQMSCYITQDFAILQCLSVRETLNIAANLKLGSTLSKQKKQAVVEDIASALGLKEALDTRVSQLSGGEKKRLSIGVELVTNPPIMFFDEPTSGLDSYSSFQIMTYLQNLAREGRTVIVVIHQPSSRLLELIDDILLLAQGMCLFNGPLNQLLPTLSSVGLQCPQYYNRADFALEIACKERGDCINELANLAKKIYSERSADFYKDPSPEDKTINDMKLATETSAMLTNGNINGMVTIDLKDSGDTRARTKKYSKRTPYGASKLTQFLILFHRSTICSLRDFRLAFLRVTAHIVVALLLGLVYYDFGNDAAKVSSNFSCIFFIVIFNFYGTAMHTVLTFPMEASVIVREHFNNWYSLGIYYLSKVLSDLPLMVLCPTLFVSLAYYLTGQIHEWDRFFMLWLVSVCLTIIAQSIGCAFGVAFSVQLGLFLTATCTMPMFLISGFFVHLNDLSPYLRWLSYTSIFKYSLEAATLTIYGYDRETMPCSQAYCHFRKPIVFLEEMGMEDGSYWLNISLLTSGIFIVQLALYLTLHWKITKAEKT